jgi:hypothetical protein
MNNRTRIVLLGLFAVLVAVWGSSASLLPLGQSDDQADRRASEDDRQPAPALFDVDEVATRLRDRQRESPAPREGGRNPFDYGHAPAPPPAVVPAPPPAEAIAPPPPSEPPAPLFTLSGIADKTGDDGKMVRTAVLSGLGQLYFAKVGDNVATRYTVTAIGADAVELRDTTTGETLRLALQ